MSNLYLTHSTLQASDLRGARLQGAYVAVANFSNTIMRGNDMEGLDLFKIILRDADLRKANLRHANFYRAIITGADFRGADLTGADLSVHSAAGAKFHKSVLVDFKFADEEESDLFHIQSRSALIVDLAMADGLEDATQKSQPYVHSYIERAFRWSHNPGEIVRIDYGQYIESAVGRIRSFYPLYIKAESPPPTLVKAMDVAGAELIKYIKNRPETLFRIDDRVFEKIVAEILNSFGWQINLTPQTRDGGYDIFAISRDISGLTTSWIVECKRYDPVSRKVGLGVVRNLYTLRSTLQHGAALFATTSSFTRDARDYEASRYNLHLKDYRCILDWINTYEPARDGKFLVQSNRLVVRQW